MLLVLCAESRRRSRQEALHPLEALELTRQRPRRCSCGAKLSRRPKCMSLVDIYRPWSSAQEGGSPLILEFLQRKPQIWAALLRPEYHTWHSHSKKFHKELSESVATVHHLMHSGFRTAAGAASVGWHAVDLCCGKSLTSALLSLDSDGPKTITAVDWRDPSGLPHHEEALARDRAHAKAAYADVPVTYLQHDVLADDFLPILQQRIEDVGRPTAILGMHLCGRLPSARWRSTLSSPWSSLPAVCRQFRKLLRRSKKSMAGACRTRSSLRFGPPTWRSSCAACQPKSPGGWRWVSFPVVAPCSQPPS